MRRVLIIFFVSVIGLSFQEKNHRLDSGSLKEVKAINERGAEDVYVLARTVFSALKMNDFEMLSNYIPDDSEIELLKKQSSERDRYIFESMTGEGLRENTKLNFEKVIQQGMDRGMNWTDVEIQESKISMCKVGDTRRCEAMMNLLDLKGKGLVISFDMIKVNNRWFLFQGMRVKSEKASLK
jgi:hypothetical protein